ncbi:MAG: hypothetical protein QM504_00235 [Pseudomonadota bacterium]
MKNFFILLLFFSQNNWLNADSLMDIPDDIVDDWDEALIIQENIQNERFEQDKQAQQNKYYQQKNRINKPLKVKKRYKYKRLKKTQQVSVKAYTQNISLKPYKSPLQKPVLYQKIYIKHK